MGIDVVAAAVMLQRSGGLKHDDEGQAVHISRLAVALAAAADRRPEQIEIATRLNAQLSKKPPCCLWCAHRTCCRAVR
jgi:hypothetical protein